VGEILAATKNKASNKQRQDSQIALLAKARPDVLTGKTLKNAHQFFLLTALSTVVLNLLDKKFNGFPSLYYTGRFVR
jgi:hypothetical protein